MNVCECTVKTAYNESMWMHSKDCIQWIHTHLLSLDQERHLRSRHFNHASMCFCVPFIQRYLHFFGKSSLFLFLFFLCYPYFGTFLFTWFLHVTLYCCKVLSTWQKRVPYNRKIRYLVEMTSNRNLLNAWFWLLQLTGNRCNYVYSGGEIMLRKSTLL